MAVPFTPVDPLAITASASVATASTSATAATALTVPENPYTLVSTVSDLSSVIDLLAPLPTSPPSLFIDLEGINLCRYGTISILTIYVAPLSTTYLIDVHTLQSLAFTTAGATHTTKTLKSILEDPAVPVVLFDVRNDNDALVNLYRVRMSGAIDVQLMELASRPGRKAFLNGLQRVLTSYPIMTPSQLIAWQSTKEIGVKLFAPEKGGSYEVFNERPLKDDVGRYCVQDVSFLKNLWELFERRLSSPALSWRKSEITQETVRRLAVADDPNYDPKGRERARGPPGWR
ncbi:hypothetical protein ABW20_dc0110319 [Dactylellina cionopaga]|nr:hypothetical protein ABW20_dc0110319 [Dactylellina cionopaga]